MGVLGFLPGENFGTALCKSFAFLAMAISAYKTDVFKMSNIYLTVIKKGHRMSEVTCGCWGARALIPLWIGHWRYLHKHTRQLHHVLTALSKAQINIHFSNTLKDELTPTDNQQLY